MKINLAKLMRVIGQLVVAAPLIVEAIKPVIRKAKMPKNSDSATD